MVTINEIIALAERAKNSGINRIYCHHTGGLYKMNSVEKNIIIFVLKVMELFVLMVNLQTTKSIHGIETVMLLESLYVVLMGRLFIKILKELIGTVIHQHQFKSNG